MQYVYFTKPLPLQRESGILLKRTDLEKFFLYGKIRSYIFISLVWICPAFMHSLK